MIDVSSLDEAAAVRAELKKLPSSSSQHDLIDKWDGQGIPHVYRYHVGRSGNLAIAERQARDLKARGDFTVSLGGVIDFGISEGDGIRLLQCLEERKIAFSERFPKRHRV